MTIAKKNERINNHVYFKEELHSFFFSSIASEFNSNIISKTDDLLRKIMVRACVIITKSYYRKCRLILTRLVKTDYITSEN